MSPQQLIAHYCITAKLGEGGMGVVYRATDTKLNRDVALKILPDSFIADADRTARFAREAQVLASLNHPNIAAIYGVEERALVLELVDGPTLAERIAAGLIPVDEALPIARQIAEALEYAHEKGVIHRDLKPANVKITPQGRVKVLDFGLAKALASEASGAGRPEASPTLTMRATMAGVILGTAAYMSPEQARGQDVDKRADIWAFGVVLYEIVTGRRLFTGTTISDTLAAVLRDEPDWEAIPPRLRRLLRLCLAREPRERLRDIGDARFLIDEPQPPIVRVAKSTGWKACAAFLALALAVLSVIHFREIAPPPPAVRFQIQAPEGNAFGYYLALSQDGRRLAFTAKARNGPPLLWVRSLNSLEARALAGTDYATSPFWSPDGRSLAFWASGKIKRIDASGGPAQNLCDAANIFGGSWGRDGQILFGAPEGIFRVPQAGGEPVLVSSSDHAKSELHWYPQVLPDGRHLLYLASFSASEKSAIYFGSLDGKEKKRVVAADRNFSYVPPAEKGKPGYLLFLREGTLMAQPLEPKTFDPAGEAFPVVERLAMGIYYASFSASATGALAYAANISTGSQLTWFDRSGKLRGTLGGIGNYSDITLSRDGRRAAVEQLNPLTTAGNIWLMDSASGTPARFTFGEASDFDPVWSPDGSHIAFSSNREGLFNLYLKDTSGAHSEERLRKADASERPCDWSPDGRSLMYVRGPSPWKLWVLSEPTGDTANRKAAPYLETMFNMTQCQFSPDGRWVAYTSNESKKGHDVFVQSFPTGSAKFQISHEGGVQPRWRRDGKELFYISADGKLMAVDVQNKPTFQNGVPHPLSDPQIVMGTGPPFAVRYDVTPDGKRFLVNSRAEAESSGQNLITVSLNWAAGLEK